MKKVIVLIVAVLVFGGILAFLAIGNKEKPAEPIKEPVVAEKTKPDVAPHVILNNLRYTPEMSKALKPRTIIKIPWGDEQNQVGGFMQDHQHLTEGMPWTFRVIDNDKFWVLDSVNKRLKLFNINGKCELLIMLAEMGRNVYDFAFSKDGIFAFLNVISGEIYFVGKDGKLIKKLQGFATATAIEFAQDGCLLVSLPAAKGKVKIAQDGQLKAIYPSKEDLSIIDNSNGELYGLRFKGKKAELTLRTGIEEETTKVLTTITYDKPQDYEVWYTGGSIYGKDAKGNVYFALVVCDANGIIYSDMIYRCSPEGKILGSLDVVADPKLTTGLPRERIVTPDGKICSATYDEDSYMIYLYQIPDNKQ